MKNLLLPVLAASALLLGACSSQKLAQDSSDDDVYFTSAKAKEIPVPVASNSQPQKEKSYKTDEQLYGGGNYTDQDYYDDYNYDYGYASRLNRFYGRSPWRSAYYDSWYSYGYYPWYTYRYDPFFYDPWYYSPGTSIWVGIGSYPRYGWHDNYYWRYYGSYYNSPYWGPYSYNNVYPGYYGGGYYGGSNRHNNNNRNYRARPDMGSGNPNVNYGNSRGRNSETIVIDRNGNRVSRPTRNDGSSSNPSAGQSGRTSSRPTRDESRPVYQEPYSRPSNTGNSGNTTSSSPSSGNSGNSGSGGGSSRGARPTRN